MKKQFHMISTGQQPKALFIEKVLAVHKEVDAIHIRERSWTAREMINTVEEIIASGVPAEKIIINDRVDVAVASLVGGVQLPGHSIDVTYVKKHHSDLRVGCSVHDIDEATRKERAGADYLLFGHVFKTASKVGLDPRGIEGLRQITERVSIPVIVIGGITPENVPAVLGAGASGIAVLSGVLLAEDPVAAVKKYNQALEDFK